MTEKGKENTNNRKLVADELLKLLNTSNKNEDNETMQQIMDNLNKTKKIRISSEILNESKIMINKYFNDECSFDDIYNSFTILLNKKEEQKATEPKLSETDIENTKQTNKICREYLEKQNKSIFDKIKDSTNKFDNTCDIFTDIPDVNMKITKDDKNNLVFSTSNKPNIDMLKDLFLGNGGDKTKENKESNENKEKLEIPSDQSFMKKMLKELYEQRVLYKKEQETKTSVDDIYKKEFYKILEHQGVTDKKLQEEFIKEQLEETNKLKDIVFKRTSQIKEQKYTIDDIVERLDKLENKISNNIEFTEYLTKKFETFLNLLNIEEI